MKEARLLRALGLSRSPALLRFAADVLSQRDEDEWKTINGTPVLIGEGGEVKAGPAKLKQDLNGEKGNNPGAKASSGPHIGVKTVKTPHIAKPAPHRQISAKEFVPLLDTAKASCPPNIAWRVDTYRTPEDFDNEGVKVYTTDGGSTFAIKPDGDIISVCKNQDTDKGTNARDLMAAAVERGGTHLDSYSGNYGFYAKCGFEVVSRCKFDKRFAPPGWSEGRDHEEDIYFMRYVGVGKVRDADEEAMKKRVPYSADYDAAAAALESALRGGN